MMTLKFVEGAEGQGIDDSDAEGVLRTTSRRSSRSQCNH